MVWGTQEELLLACAVDRHGTRRWDSVATELQSRSSVFPSVSPLACQKKFNDLRRRFFKSRQPDESASLVDKLRKIRVEELRREVQRRDESILSLELKVKRLEEEKERSVIGEEAGDLKDRQANDAGESVAGGESDFCENGSFKESNSSSQKGGERKIVKREPYEPVHGGGTRNEPDRDGSINVNSDGVDDKDDNINIKEPIEMVMETTIQPNRVGESNEEVLLEMESMGESKRAASKQSSDVQSSASLSKKSKKKRCRKGGGAVVRESSSGEEEDADEVSPATFRTTMTKQALAMKCEPMVRLLETIRSHRLGSVFERRLRSQEWARYKNLIRQHMDLQTVQSRIDKGMYSDCTNRFFRDLLLLFNNAVIFFSRNTPEHAAALELRAIVCKEITVDYYKLTTPKLEPQVDSASKPKETSGMVVCGRRSSVKAVSENRKGVRKEANVEENHKPPPYDNKITRVIARKVNHSFVSTEENGHFWKKSSDTNKETSNVLGRRSAKTSNKGGGGGEEHEYGGNELSSHDALEVIKTIDKMRETSSTTKKKQGAARFLRRMKQNSPSSSEGEEEEDDANEEEDVLSSEDTDSKSCSKRRGGKDEEKKNKKKKRGRKEIGRRERVKRNSGGRGVREESGKVKRGVGRPPKRSGTGKKRKDNEEDSEGVVVAGRPRKRSRR